jgi:hypothetical protein
MAENDEPKQSKWQHIRKDFEDAMQDSSPWLRVPYGLLKREWSGIKQGWLVFLVLLGAAVWVVGSQAYEKGAKSRDEEVSTANASSRTNQVIATVLRDDKATLLGLVAEKNAEIQRLTLKLQPWEQMATSIMTNKPAHEQLSSLFTLIQGVTNSLGLLGASGIDFELLANDKVVTNLGSITLGTDNRLFLSARNSGEITAEQVMMVFNSAMNTNITHPGWRTPGSFTEFDKIGAKDLGIPILETTAQFNLASGYAFSASPLFFKTNSFNIIPATITITANRAKRKDFMVIIRTN